MKKFVFLFLFTFCCCEKIPWSVPEAYVRCVNSCSGEIPLSYRSQCLEQCKEILNKCSNQK